MSGVCIGSVGELLVEFVCTEKDHHHLRAARSVGPFPSGAPGIFIDQAARSAGALGGPAGRVGSGVRYLMGLLRRAKDDGRLSAPFDGDRSRYIQRISASVSVMAQ